MCGSTCPLPSEHGIIPEFLRALYERIIEEIVHEPTVTEVGRGLVEGRYSVGIAFTALGDEHPGALEVGKDIGTVCDAWVMFGTQPVDEGRTVVWYQVSQHNGPKHDGVAEGGDHRRPWFGLERYGTTLRSGRSGGVTCWARSARGASRCRSVAQGRRHSDAERQ